MYVISIEASFCNSAKKKEEDNIIPNTNII